MRQTGSVIVAEGEGFEPPELSLSGFQDHRLRPLGHPSANRTTASFNARIDPASGRKLSPDYNTPDAVFQAAIPRGGLSFA